MGDMYDSTKGAEERAAWLKGKTRAQKNCRGRRGGYGGCERCHDTWNWKKYHVTEYGEGGGCFPLCEECWKALSPTERTPFYDRLVDSWLSMCEPEEYPRVEEDRKLIHKAVLEGK
jgi:hypothetical protein